MRVIFPSSCRYLLPNTPGGALQQIWPNQFWLRRFSWFSGFPPLFWHRLPCFREGDACVGRQPPDTGGNFLRLGKNAAFNVGFAQFEPESFLALQFDHHRRRIWFHATSWTLWGCWMGLLVLDGVWFFLVCLFSAVVFFSIVVFVGVAVRWELAPHLLGPIHKPALLYNGETHIK